ncbi:type IV pili methyl-accepting chemotaxis transducer N-terminal domain-containing protein [Nitrosophilus kaiyonis]|uniref:type IV pili methyl-accepting chemotaxis transducer N-terminal domain-containing protein n=1 Tax=Nitrosophilus kaiyonis TaxID=2930200 RepID=UPI0024938244|nr:type IV pili methyl-accepting chemotaxis transducer N-terminal domain-containing protein [Nitrosophilus kaiyonis]
MKKITSQIKFIGGALSLTIIAIVASVIYINQKSKNDSIVINIAGKERMLTQKISKEIFRLKTARIIELKELNDAQNLFEINLYSLLNGDKKRGIYPPPTLEIKEQLLRVEKLWLPFKEKIEIFKKIILKIENEKNFVFDNNDYLLNISDKVVKTMVKTNVKGYYIDKAGRQRMLSQRMMYFLLLYLNESDPRYYRIFYETLHLYDMTLKQFYNDKDLIEIKELKDILEKNYSFWNEYILHAKNLIEMQSKLNDTVDYIKEFNNILLNGMDQAVSMYTIYSERQRTLLENIEYILAMIAIVIIFYSFFLIINIQKHFEEFMKKSKSLISFDKDESKICEHTDELTIASKRLENFIQKVDRMIIDAQNAIKTSEYLTKELSDVSELLEKNAKDIDKTQKKELEKYLDTSEDIAIQSLEDLEKSAKLLQKLHENLSNILEQTKK